MNMIRQFTASAITLLVLAGCGQNTMGVNSYTESCLANVDYESLGIPSFSADLNAIEHAWSESVPDNLLLVGGIDGFGWARICVDNSASTDEFYGEYWDRHQRYRGAFRYSPSPGMPKAKDIVEQYYMSHYSPDRGMLILAYAGNSATTESLFLQPADPEQIEHPVDD